MVRWITLTAGYPQTGMTLNRKWDEMLVLYGEVDFAYEGLTMLKLDDHLMARYPAYTFRQDYYFMMGDNRDNSRFPVLGFVAEDHIVGKLLFV